MFGVNSESAHGQPRRARYRRGGFTSSSGQVVRLPDLRQWAMTPPPHILPRSNRRPYGIASTACTTTMHPGKVPPNKGRLAMKERGKEGGLCRWQLGAADFGKLRLRGNLHCCDAGERWCAAAGGNNRGQCCSICRQQTFFGHALRYCGGRGRSDLWRQHRFLGRPGIWYVVAFEMGISHRARRAEEEAGTVSICSPRREDRLLRTFRRFAARLCGTAGRSKRIVPFAVPRLQCGRGNCLGDSVRSRRIRAWRRYSSNRWTIWMGGAYCSDRFCRPSLALLQEK